MERPNLLASVEEPKAEEEPVAAAIWEAMDGLTRFKVIRTEKYQTQY
ncbi:hypothetical protein PSPO01_15253 [Paraphaeosphaeria sporulosa]